MHLHVVVTYAPPNTQHFWAQDKSGGGFAWLAVGKAHFPLGEALDLQGVSDPGKFGPCLKVIRYYDLGRGTQPEPVEAPLQRLLSGSEDGRRIQISGRLIALTPARTQTEQTRMVLSADGNHIPVRLIGPPIQDADTLLDSEVRMVAVSSVTFNEHRQFTGIVLNLARPEDLTVLIPGSDDLPVTQIDKLLRYQPGIGITDNHVRLEGVATYCDGRKLLVIQNGSHAAFVQLAAPDDLKAGDSLSVFGYPRAKPYTPILIEGRAYPHGHKMGVTPLRLTAGEAMSGQFDALLVRMTADLVDRSYSRAQQTLTLRDGPISFVAQFPEDTKNHVSGLQIGSTLDLTGVLQVQPAVLSKAPQSIHLLLRNGSDIIVVKRPPWLSRTRLLYLALVLTAAVICVLIWVSVLRRQVLRQTMKLMQQRKREAQLEESNRILVENASDLIFTLSLDGRFLSANAATGRLSGWPVSSLTGTSLSDLIVGHEQELFRAWFADLLTTSYSAGEFDINANTGAVHTVDLSAHVSHSISKQAQVEFVGRDVTERKRAHIALEQARLAAEKANAAKTRFLANMSHEIRTPLNAILGTADLLAATDLTADQRAYVATFQNSGNSLLVLLNSLLDLTKVESGQLQLEAIPFSVENLVTEVVGMMAGRPRKKDIRLSSKIDSSVPNYLVGDPGRLFQILSNLVGNAVKFTERGEIMLEVTTSDNAVLNFGTASKKVTATFKVKDTGIGISAEKHQLIFERFTQADNSITRRFGGSGLGLSISKGLAQAMGGAIEVASVPGVGSVFTLTVPLGQPAPMEIAQSLAASDAQTFDVTTTLKERQASLLIAEDNDANFLIVEAYLKGFPFKVDRAHNGRQAVEMEARKTYDLILMDIEMPEIDGYEASRQIRERRSGEGLPQISILALTAHAFDEERDMAELAGCSELLTKPIRRKVLLSALARHLTRFVPEGEQVF